MSLNLTRSVQKLHFFAFKLHGKTTTKKYGTTKTTKACGPTESPPETSQVSHCYGIEGVTSIGPPLYRETQVTQTGPMKLCPVGTFIDVKLDEIWRNFDVISIDWMTKYT